MNLVKYIFPLLFLIIGCDIQSALVYPVKLTTRSSRNFKFKIKKIPIEQQATLWIHNQIQVIEINKQPVNYRLQNASKGIYYSLNMSEGSYDFILRLNYEISKTSPLGVSYTSRRIISEGVPFKAHLKGETSYKLTPDKEVDKFDIDEKAFDPLFSVGAPPNTLIKLYKNGNTEEIKLNQNR